MSITEQTLDRISKTESATQYAIVVLDLEYANQFLRRQGVQIRIQWAYSTAAIESAEAAEREGRPLRYHVVFDYENGPKDCTASPQSGTFGELRSFLSGFAAALELAR